ncbi:MAG: hypothetical protein RL885_05685 [Planctomycetota bacterium]
MPMDYARIRQESRRRFGEEFDRFGKQLLQDLYSDRTHFLFELLQNAEDAIKRRESAGTKHRRVRFELFEDRLEVRHYGVPFTEGDVRAICSIGESSKKDELTQIGRFGMGFKSVSAYSLQPEIHSGDEHFRIECYVRPHAVQPRVTDEGETLIVLPFDSPEVSAERAYDEIANRLRRLDSTTLLFLRSIESLEWTIVGRQSARETITRREKRSGAIRGVTVRREAIGEDEGWVVFERATTDIAPGLPPVEIAFRIEKTESGRQVRPLQRSPLVVFFPTEKELGLGFLVQGPFRTTTTRENIPVQDEINRALAWEVVELIGETLPLLREANLADIHLLEALPLDRRTFPEDHLLSGIFERVKTALLEEPLIPAEGGGHLTAQQALLPERQNVERSLFSAPDLVILFGESRDWITPSITSDRSPEVWRYLRDELGLETTTLSELVPKIREDFMAGRTAEWTEELFDAIHTTWCSRQRWTREWLADRPIVRLDDGRHVPLVSEGGPSAFIPVPGFEISLPIVAPEVASRPGVRRLLQAAGFEEADPVSDVIENLLPRYEAARADNLDEGDYFKDLERLRRALATDSRGRREALLEAIRETPISLAANAAIGQVDLKRPTEVYLRSAGLDLYFERNPAAWFILPEVADALGPDCLVLLGVATRVRIQRRDAGPEGHVVLERSKGRHRRGRDGFDPDAEADGLEHALKNMSPEKARFIWNEIARPNHRLLEGAVERSSRQTYQGATSESVESPLGKLLRSRAWLPKDGRFVMPREVSLDDLPYDFERSEDTASALGMATGVDRKLCEQAGMPADLPRLYRKHQKLFQVLIERIRRQSAAAPEAQPVPTLRDVLTLHTGEASSAPIEETLHLEPGPVPDSERRRSRVTERVRADAAEEPALHERYRLEMKHSLEKEPSEIRDLLRTYYVGHCQICDATFPTRSGEAYFETVHLVDRKRARLFDRPECTIALCPTCRAKWVYGDSGLSPDALESLEKYKPGQIPAELPARLCGALVVVRFSERHLLDLQTVMLATEGSR